MLCTPYYLTNIRKINDPRPQFPLYKIQMRIQSMNHFRTQQAFKRNYYRNWCMVVLSSLILWNMFVSQILHVTLICTRFFWIDFLQKWKLIYLQCARLLTYYTWIYSITCSFVPVWIIIKMFGIFSARSFERSRICVEWRQTCCHFVRYMKKTINSRIMWFYSALHGETYR